VEIDANAATVRREDQCSDIRNGKGGGDTGAARRIVVSFSLPRTINAITVERGLTLIFVKLV